MDKSITEKSILHIIQTVFTGRRTGCPNQEWLEARIEIFKNFTLKSLLNQTNKSFLHWISWASNEKQNEAVKNLGDYLKNLNYNFVFTFYGQPIYEPHTDHSKINNIIADSLKEIKQLHKGERFVYFTILDSDDLFHKDAVKEIQSHDFEDNKALYYTRGYCLNTQINELSYWDMKECPPFYTVLFKNEVFFDPIKFFDYMVCKIKVHRDLPKAFPKSVKLVDRKYLVTINGKNIATRWTSRRSKKVIKDQERESILRDFGI